MFRQRSNGLQTLRTAAQSHSEQGPPPHQLPSSPSTPHQANPSPSRVKTGNICRENESEEGKLSTEKSSLVGFQLIRAGTLVH